MRWAQSSRKLSIISLTLCPLYSLINGAGAYSITVNACKLVWVVVVFEGSGGLLGFESWRLFKSISFILRLLGYAINNMNSHLWADRCYSDENQELQFNQPQAPAQINNSKDALQIPSGPITRSRTQKLKEALIGLIQDILTAQTKSKIKLKPNHVLNLIWADEGIKWRRFGLKANHLKRMAHRKCISRFSLSVNGLFWA